MIAPAPLAPLLLVDTSVWVEHLRSGHARLIAALMEEEVATHSAVIGELACGNIGNRAELLGLLGALPRTREAEPDEVLKFIEAHRLAGRGIGYVDVQLLASAAITPGTRLFTLDKRLARVATELGLAA